MCIDVAGTQGHDAYPHKADNPVEKLGRIVAALNLVKPSVDGAAKYSAMRNLVLRIDGNAREMM